MSYDDFSKRVFAIAKRSGSRVKVFHEDGKHIARFDDGTRITGNTVCPKVTVMWGSGHTATIAI